MWDVLKEYAGSKRLLNSMKAFNNDADASFWLSLEFACIAWQWMY